MQARLAVYQNGKQELCAPIPASGAGIGRDAGNAVQLPQTEVSRRHAIVQHTSQGWYVRDLGSRNGLFVNGRRVKDALLKDGDKLTIGPYELVFEVEKAAQPYHAVLQLDSSEHVEQQTMFLPKPPGLDAPSRSPATSGR